MASWMRVAIAEPGARVAGPVCGGPARAGCMTGAKDTKPRRSHKAGSRPGPGDPPRPAMRRLLHLLHLGGGAGEAVQPNFSAQRLLVDHVEQLPDRLM